MSIITPDYKKFSDLISTKKFVEKKIIYYNKQLKGINAELIEMNKRLKIGEY